MHEWKHSLMNSSWMKPRRPGLLPASALAWVAALALALFASTPAMAQSVPQPTGPRVTQMKAQILTTLTKAIHDRDPRVRASAVSALEDLGPEAVPALLQAAQSKDPRVRSHALNALARMWNRIEQGQRRRTRRTRRTARGRHASTTNSADPGRRCFTTTKTYHSCIRLGPGAKPKHRGRAPKTWKRRLQKRRQHHKVTDARRPVWSHSRFAVMQTL